jgi:hypothetical protein
MTMGKKDEARRGNNGAATIQEAPTAEQAPPVEMPYLSHDDGAAEAPLRAPGETTATEAPQDEPGLMDFKRHGGARLVSDHEADLLLRKELDNRIELREEEMGTRLRAKGPGATITIAGSEYTARVKPNSGGKMGVAKVTPRVRTTIDI